MLAIFTILIYNCAPRMSPEEYARYRRDRWSEFITRQEKYADVMETCAQTHEVIMKTKHGISYDQAEGLLKVWGGITISRTEVQSVGTVVSRQSLYTLTFCNGNLVWVSCTHGFSEFCHEYVQLPMPTPDELTTRFQKVLIRLDKRDRATRAVEF